MATIIVKRKALTWAEKTYIPQIFKGLWITLRNIFKKPVTLQYPEEKPELPAIYRGIPTLVMDPSGREKCVSCQLCEFVCPPKAIRITPGSIDPNGSHAHIEKAPQEFEINMLRCIYCGLCQEVCPEEAIFLQKEYSLSGLSREELVFKKSKLYQLGGKLPDAHFKWDKKLKAEEKGPDLH